MRTCKFCTLEATLACKCDLKDSAMCLTHSLSHPGTQGHKIISLYQNVQNPSHFLKLIQDEIARAERFKDSFITEFKADIEKYFKDFHWKLGQINEIHEILTGNLKVFLMRKKFDIGIHEKLIEKSAKKTFANELSLCKTSISVQCGDFLPPKEQLITFDITTDSEIISQKLLELQSEIGPEFVNSLPYLIFPCDSIQNTTQVFEFLNDRGMYETILQHEKNAIFQFTEDDYMSLNEILKTFSVKEAHAEVNLSNTFDENPSKTFYEILSESSNASISIFSSLDLLYDTFQKEIVPKGSSKIMQLLSLYLGSNVKLNLNKFSNFPDVILKKIDHSIRKFMFGEDMEEIMNFYSILQFVGKDILFVCCGENFMITCRVSTCGVKSICESLLKFQEEY